MSTQPSKYPLEQVLEVKKDRVEKAEKVVREKKRLLEVEKEKLERVEKERDLVLHHHNEKLSQIREALDEGTTSDKVIGMKSYLKVVKEKLVKEEIKVKDQKKNVEQAEEQLETAKKEWQKRRIEAEKIELHKQEWLKGITKELEREEAKEYDELGTTLHLSKKKQKKDQSL